MVRFWLFGLALIGSVLVSGQSNAEVVQFNLQGSAGFGLLPGNENPANASAVTGGEIGSGITFDNVTKILAIRVGWGSGSGFTGSLTGNASAAHIHAITSGGPVFTSNGPVIIGLNAAPFLFDPTAISGTIFGNIALNATQEAQLFNSQLYINVHTVANPGGEIRGNLVAVPEPSSIALVGIALAGFGAWKRRKRRQA